MLKKNLILSGLILLLFNCVSKHTIVSGEKSFRLAFDKKNVFRVTLDSAKSPFDLRASEPSVVINRKNSGWIMAGSILDNYYFSEDGGKTWSKGNLVSQYGVFGDPVLFSDPAGNFYYFHLALKERAFLPVIVVQKTTDGGKNWTDTGIGYNPPKQQDKPWVGYDAVSKTLAVTWTEFDRYESRNPDDHSRILFSLSEDEGTTWTQPVKINDLEGDCLDDDQTTEGATPVFIDRDTVLTVWAYDNKIWFDKSFDRGKTWGKDQVIANQEAGWTFDFPGIYRANGLPWFVRDTVTGRLLVLFGDKSPDGKIKFTYSDDKGETWQPVKVLKPDAGDQFFPAVVAIHGHNVFAVVFYDRPANDTLHTRVKLGMYDYEGNILDTLVLSQSLFVPDKRIFFGDYIDLDFDGENLVAVWTEIRRHKTQCFFAKIPVRITK